MENAYKAGAILISNAKKASLVLTIYVNKPAEGRFAQEAIAFMENVTHFNAWMIDHVHFLRLALMEFV